jgi:hypothetical protein
MEITAGASSRTFTGDTVRIGRAMDNDVVVLNGSVSRHHAELRHDGSRWELVDLESRQGTYIDGTRVARHHVATAIEVVVGQPRRGEALRLVPLEPANRTDSADDAYAGALQAEVPFILTDPPTRRVHRRRRP